MAKIRGLSSEKVDQLVEQVTAEMLKSARVSLDVAIEAVLSANTVLVAAGEQQSKPTLTSLHPSLEALTALTVEWTLNAGRAVVELIGKIFNMGSTTAVLAVKDAYPRLEPLSVPAVQSSHALAHLAQSEKSVNAFASRLWDVAREELVTGFQEGESIDALATRLRDVTELTKAKAHSIAQTEVISALNAGEYAQMQELAQWGGMTVVKEWLATEDSHTRPSHHKADGQRIALNESFVVGTDRLRYPGDPTGSPGETINCRCTTVYDISDASVETLLEDAPIDTNGLVAASWNPSEHPRGSDGKFIKKDFLPGTLFEFIKPGVKPVTVGQTQKLIDSVMDMSAHHWAKLTSLQKSYVEDHINDALDDNFSGAAQAQLHLDELNHEVGDFSAADFEEVEELNIEPDPILNDLTLDQIETQFKKGLITKDEKAKLIAGSTKKTDTSSSDPTPSSSSSSTPWTGSFVEVPLKKKPAPTPVKVTHALIHAKHAPGTVIAESPSGIKVRWNGSSYDIVSGKNGNTKLITGVKKSKLYETLAQLYPNGKWQTPGSDDDDDDDDSSASAVATPTPTPTPTVASPPTPASSIPTASATTIPHPTAPKSQVHDLTGWKKISGAKGSNPGGIFESPDGTRYYVKKAKSETHAKNEVLANDLYRAAGIDVPEVRHGVNAPEFGNVVVSKIVPNAMSDPKALTNDPVVNQQIRSGFTVDAWLANWDVVGLTSDNIVVSDGKPWRIDAGGALLYRAQGTPKGALLTDTVSELATLRSSSKNASAAKVFGGITDAEMRESAKRLLPITDSKIDQMVKDAGLPDSLATTLKKRRADIFKHVGLSEDGTTNPKASDAITPTPTLTPTPTPSSSLPTAASPTTTVLLPKGDISHLTFAEQYDFYHAFKAEKVSPSWSGLKIYTSLQKAKQKNSSNSKIANLSDEQMLAIVDKQHYHLKMGNPKDAYSTKLRAWLKTPNGKKEYQKYHGSGSAAFVKKMTSAAPISSVPTYGKKAVKKAAKKAAKKVATKSSLGSLPPGSKLSKNLPYEQKIAQLSGPGPLDTNLKSSDFPVLTTKQAEDIFYSQQSSLLTPAQKASVRYYTGEDYVGLNNYLRGTSDATSAQQKHVNNIQAAMKPSQQNMTLHRRTGTIALPPEFRDPANVGKLPGAVIRDKAFFSTSVGGHAAMGGHGVSWVIEAPVGTPMTYVDTYSKHQGEREMLLGAGLSYQVISAAVKPGKYPGSNFIEMRVRVVSNDAA